MAKNNLIGAWAFLIGVVLAIIAGAFSITSIWMVYTLVVIGLIVGLLNIADKEAAPFMMSGVVLIIAGALGKSEVAVIPLVGNILSALLLIFVPATVIVAVRNVFGLARR